MYKVNDRVYINMYKKVGIIKEVKDDDKYTVRFYGKDDKPKYAELTSKEFKRAKKPLEVKIKKLADDAIVPKYQTRGAAGFDIHAHTDEEAFVIKPNERMLIKTKLAFAVPIGYELQLRPRSGLALKHGITLTNSPATIDSDYRGEVGAIIQNTGWEDFVINHGDRICQGVIVPVKQAKLKVVDELDDTKRGDGGFGHSGIK